MTPQDFVAHEARLVDEQRFAEWLDLFAEDGRYWVPLAGAAQAEGQAYNALADEDRLLLSLRVRRLADPKAHSQHPRSRCQHVLQGSQLVAADDAAGTCELRTPFLYIESRGARQLLLAGTATHRLVRAGDAWRIRMKRVDLLDAAEPLPAIQLFP